MKYSQMAKEEANGDIGTILIPKMMKLEQKVNLLESQWIYTPLSVKQQE